MYYFYVTWFVFILKRYIHITRDTPPAVSYSIIPCSTNEKMVKEGNASVAAFIMQFFGEQHVLKINDIKGSTRVMTEENATSGLGNRKLRLVARWLGNITGCSISDDAFNFLNGCRSSSFSCASCLVNEN